MLVAPESLAHVPLQGIAVDGSFDTSAGGKSNLQGYRSCKLIRGYLSEYKADAAGSNGLDVLSVSIKKGTNEAFPLEAKARGER